MGIEQGGARPSGRATGTGGGVQRPRAYGEGGSHVAGVPRAEGGGAEDLGGEGLLTGEPVGQRARPRLTLWTGLEQAELEQGADQSGRFTVGVVVDEEGQGGAILGELRTDRLDGRGLPR